MLVVKQNIKNKKLYSNGHGKMRNNSNQNYKTPNSSQNNLNNNPSDNYQNRNNYNKYYTRYSYDDNNQKNQTSTSKSRIDINKKNLRQNETHSSGNVTDKLRAYQFHLSQNQKVLLFLVLVYFNNFYYFYIPCALQNIYFYLIFD